MIRYVYKEYGDSFFTSYLRKLKVPVNVGERPRSLQSPFCDPKSHSGKLVVQYSDGVLVWCYTARYRAFLLSYCRRLGLQSTA